MTQTPPQQYCLRWNNYQNNLTNVFDQLLQSEAFVDVTLACDGHSLKAHKMVLSACSPFFQTLFFDNPCSHPIVILKDISWEELKAVVEFMYRGEINVSQEQLAPLLKVAEMLKIRGLADVSRGGGGPTGSGSRDGGEMRGGSSTESGSRNGPNPADFMSTSNHDSEPGSPLNSNGHLLNHPLLQGHHLSPLNSLLSAGASGASASLSHHHSTLASLHRRKRRKMSTPERTPSPPEDDLDDQSSNQLEIDSQNGDWNNSPRSLVAGERASSDAAGGAGGGSGRDGASALSTPTPANTPSLSAAAAAAATVGMSLAAAGGNSAASSLVGPMGPAFLNLHAAAAAAAAVANANSSAASGGASSTGGGGGGGAGGAAGNNPPSTSSSLASDMDLKPGIVEMIREEERAKMLESSHGWLGPSAASSLTDTYQYQIQNLWQKCWNQNQGGVVHALRFRERGPLKSWRPETMAEAIFAVLRDGLSLSQAARKYDIPYPTFVLYANRVHNMLGPSADGCSGSDLMSDMRPKGRGRPQRILLGSWPEEHIRGVIRAVVFRDTQGGKDDFPFIFNRETGLCLPQTAGASSHNGLDMSLPQFANPFLNPNSSMQPPSSSSTPKPVTSSASGGGEARSSSERSRGGDSGGSTLGVNLINLSEPGSLNVAAALQHLHQLQQQGSLSASSTSAAAALLSHPGSPSSSNSNSPLQQVLSSAGLLSAQAQRELLALQQRHQRRLSSGAGGDALDLLTKKGMSSEKEPERAPSVSSILADAEGILQIKSEPISTSSPCMLSTGANGDPSPMGDDHNDGDVEMMEPATVNDTKQQRSKEHHASEEDTNTAAVMALQDDEDDDDQPPTPSSFALKASVNSPCGQSTSGGQEGALDFGKLLRNAGEGASPNGPSPGGNNGENNNSPKGSSTNNQTNNHNPATTATSTDGDNVARRASLRTATTTGETATTTRMRSASSSGGGGSRDREVNTPSPLNFPA